MSTNNADTLTNQCL